jgi:hypothetical protein
LKENKCHNTPPPQCLLSVAKNQSRKDLV